MTHYSEWFTIEYDDQEIEVYVDFEYSPYRPAKLYPYPGEPAEDAWAEVHRAWVGVDRKVEANLSDQHRKQIEEKILDNPPEPDYD